MSKEPKQLKGKSSPVQSKYKRKKGLPKTEPSVELDTTMDVEELKRKSEDYVHLTVTGSDGKQYKIAVPKSFEDSVPKTWVWDRRKEVVANMLADGIPISQIVKDPDSGVKARVTIYGWLEHPEFRDHVNGLILTTGIAMKNFRIASAKRLHSALEAKLMREIDHVEVNEKTLHAFLANYQSLMKMIAQEKEELVERVASTVDQTTKLEGAVGVATMDVNVDQMLQSLPADERKKLQEELNELGDSIIRSIKTN